MFIQRSMRNLNAAKGPPIRLCLSFFSNNLCISVVAPSRHRIIKHEMACKYHIWITDVQHQLFKDAAVYISAIIFEDSLPLALLAQRCH